MRLIVQPNFTITEGDFIEMDLLQNLLVAPDSNRQNYPLLENNRFYTGLLKRVEEILLSHGYEYQLDWTYDPKLRRPQEVEIPLDYLPGIELRAHQLMASQKLLMQGGRGLVCAGCLTANTPVPLLNGDVKTIKELSDLYSGRPEEEFHTYSYVWGKKIGVGTAKNPRMTGYDEVFKVWLDDGTYFEANGDHEMVLRDGGKMKVKHFVSGTSLMRFQRRFDTYGKGQNTLIGYERVLHPDGSWEPTHRLVAKWKNGRVSFHRVAHHKDFNKLNNDPSNLCSVRSKLHRKYHSGKAFTGKNNSEARAKRSSDWIKSNPELHSARSRKGALAAHAPEVHNKTVSGLKRLCQDSSHQKFAASFNRGKVPVNLPWLNERGLNNFARMKSYVGKTQRVLDFSGFSSPLEMTSGEWTRFSEHGRGRSVSHDLACRLWNESWHLKTWDQYKSETNHKVVKVESLGVQPIYCLTVRDYHNFAILTRNSDGSLSSTGLISGNTGAGKTEVACVVAKWLKCQTVFVCYRVKHAIQAVARFKKYGIDCGLLTGDVNDIDHQVVCAVAASLYAGIRRSDQDVCELLKRTEFLLMDEAHHLNSRSWMVIGDYCPAPHRAGLSASAFDDPSEMYYEDMLLIGQTGEVVCNVPPRWLIDQGFAAEPLIYYAPIHTQRIPGFQWQPVYDQGIVDNFSRNCLFTGIAEILSLQGYKTLILVQRIQHGKNLLNLLQDPSVVFSFGGERFFRWDGELIEDKMGSEELLKRFDEQPSGILIGSTVFDESIDMTGVKALIMAGGGKKYRRTLQRVGRASHSQYDFVHVFDTWDYQHPFLQKHSRERLNTYNLLEYKAYQGLGEFTFRTGIPINMQQILMKYARLPGSFVMHQEPV